MYEIGEHENNHLEHAIACHAENSWPMFNANISLKVSKLMTKNIKYQMYFRVL